MKYKFILLILILYPITTKAQFALGVEPCLRFSNDKVGQTYNLGVVVHQYVDSALIRFGFFSSLPVYVKANAKVDAYDSTTVPFSLQVPSQQKISDYILFLGGGLPINPNKKKNCLVFTFDLRFILRNVDTKLTGNYDRSLYSNKFTPSNSSVPAAINLGFNLGLGYQVKVNKLVIFPKFSFGFGSSDVFDKHPWNSFPNYMEVNLAIMINSKRIRKN